MSILKPFKNSAMSSLSFKAPADLDQRLTRARTSASARGLSLDIDGALVKALARLLKQAERELAELQPGNIRAEGQGSADSANEGVSHG